MLPQSASVLAASAAAEGTKDAQHPQQTQQLLQVVQQLNSSHGAAPPMWTQGLWMLQTLQHRSLENFAQ